MPSFDIKRALIDRKYRKTLSPEQLAELARNPAGDPTLSEEQLDKVVGGLPCQTTSGSCLASKRTLALGCGC
jgi:mersacidin/lichenicidin family type 2 lantibiotic